jgi:AcrR family transcriptional regulator
LKRVSNADTLVRMSSPATPSSAKPGTRHDRRKAETRARLLAAARELFAEQGVGATRTGEITERADVAAGSFYNHFEGKDEIVETLLRDIAESQGALIDEMTAPMDDAAEIISCAHRHLVRLAADDRVFGQLAIRLDASHRLMTEALGPRAARDIKGGIDAGRFTVADAVAAVFQTGGALLGTIRGVVEGALGDGADEVHAAGVLRMLGIEGAEAERIATLPLPSAPA